MTPCPTKNIENFKVNIFIDSEVVNSNTENLDNSFKVSFTPKKKGNYEINVAANGEVVGDFMKMFEPGNILESFFPIFY